MIFALTKGCDVGGPSGTAAPVFIGVAVTAVIAFVVSLAQGGIDPA